MKILFVTRVPITAVRFIFPLAKRLRDKGSNVEFAFGPGEGLEDVRNSGFGFTLLSMDKESSSLANVRVVGQLTKVIKNGHYDVVHTYSPVIGIYGRIAALMARTPVVIHSAIGSLLGAGVPMLHRFLYLLSELTTSWMVDLFITLNDADSHTLVKYRLTSREKVVSLKYEYGVDLEEFNPQRVDSATLNELRNQLGLEQGLPILGFVGRMIRAKGILDLFAAYQIIRANGIRAKLLYLGDVLSTDKDRESYATLKHLVTNAGFQNDVVFVGFQRDVPLFISLMDLVILPSHHEGFPRIPVEAGAMGKPSICTAVSGADVAIENGKTGFIVPIRDPTRLAESIQRIVSNPSLARQMGIAARKRTLSLFDQNTIVGQQVKIYEDLLNGEIRRQYD